MANFSQSLATSAKETLAGMIAKGKKIGKKIFLHNLPDTSSLKESVKKMEYIQKQKWPTEVKQKEAKKVISNLKTY